MGRLWSRGPRADSLGRAANMTARSPGRSDADGARAAGRAGISAGWRGMARRGRG